MSTPTAARILRQTTRNATRHLIRPPPSRQCQFQRSLLVRTAPSTRSFSTSRVSKAGLMPDTEDPQPPKEDPAANGARPTQPTELTDEEYHTISEELMDAINDKAEALQETREDVEVEYSAGVLNVVFPPNGTYVINKQPPNKQIWLSSPISGPKRYDWVLEGESMHQKEGSGRGEWVYLRDGTKLSELLQKELGLLIDSHEVDTASASKDPTE